MREIPAPAPLPTESVPCPPRYWWLRRIAIASLLFLALFAAVRVLVARHVDGMARERIDAYHARGERVEMADYRTPPPPDGQNAADLLKQAAGMMAGLDNSPKYSAISWIYPMPVAGVPAAGVFVHENAPALALVRQARRRSQFDWRLDFNGRAIAILLPHLSQQRALAQRLADAAMYAHSVGDDAAAVEYFRDMLFVAKATDVRPFLVSHLVAMGINALTCARATPCISTLAVDDHAAGSPATREHLRGLVADLLDDGPFQDGLRESIGSERLVAWDWANAICDGRLEYDAYMASMFPNPPSAPVARQLKRLVVLALAPLVKRDAVTLLDYDTAAAAAGAKQDYPAAAAALPIPPGVKPSKYVSYTPLSALLAPSLSRVFLSHFRVVRDRRAMAIAVAARLYQADHGHPPANVAAMVPEYLPAVPLDPLKGGGAVMTLPAAATTAPTTRAR